MLGRRIKSNRAVSKLPASKQWGGIVRVRDDYFVDIRWADGTLSRNQYIGDYLMWPGDDYIEPEIKENWDDKARRIEIAHRIKKKEERQQRQMLKPEDIFDER